MLLDMEHNRIQKLLLSEYCDFSDKVLIESPFAETTRDGRGLRQVALGLTPSKLVIAADILKKHSEFTCPSELDPSIESFELVSIYPIEFIALSVFCRRKRRTLKARLVDGRAKYYELGGMKCRSVYWALWMENVRELNAKRADGSSLSETTAASSSSASTLYLLSSGIETKTMEQYESKNRSKYRVWAHYGGAGDGQSGSWRRKDIYLGPSYEELSQGYYTPVPVRFAGASLEEVSGELKDGTPKSLICRKNCSSWPCTRPLMKSVEFNRAGALCDVLFTRERRKRNKKQRPTRVDLEAFNCTVPESEWRGIPSSPLSRRGRIQQKHRSGSPRKHGSSVAPKLSRFGFGVGENCSSGLYLEPWQGEREGFRRTKSRIDSRVDPQTLIESGVHVWENPGDGKFRRKTRPRHPRRYALATAPHFFHALGPWPVQPGERESVQSRRACSAVSVRRQPLEPELRLPVSKRQLTASVSMTSLDPGKTGTMSSSTRGRVVLFWTPEYWYRPRAATAAYQELRRHLSLIRDFRANKERGKKTFFCRLGKSSHCQGDYRESKNGLPAEEKSSCLLGRIFSSKDTGKKERHRGEKRDGGASQLRRLLRMELRITAWDLDSSTIARQLTLIDRELFLRIPCAEIEILLNQKSSRNTPNLGAWIAFSHRISCLTASEILATKKLDMRTRLLSRLINAADKCYALGNFHSCRSILAGLESPPVYRLNATWSHLRTHHSTRYETMEQLCKIYRNTRSRSYRRVWKMCERNPPFLPYVGHLLDKIIYQDDEQRSDGITEWKSEPCRFPLKDSCCSMGRVSATIESACRKIVANNATEGKITGNNCNVKKSGAKGEKLVERQSSLGKRIVSAAMSKIGYSRSGASEKSNMEIPWTTRQEELAKKCYARWRRSILTRKMLSEKAAKIKMMDPKKRKVMTIGSWLCECQKHCQQYHFPRHSLAWEFLLKARYREERDNFFISLKLEPPRG